MGKEIKPGGGGALGWLKGAIWSVAKSGAAAQTWKAIEPYVVGAVVTLVPIIVGIVTEAPALTIVVAASIVFAAVAFGAVKARAFLEKPALPGAEHETPGQRPVQLVRDMTFRDALRHFAYKSRWAHDFEHPEGDWMTVVRWPQAVHREFCQPLIDGDLDAWGVRQEPGKERENGHTPIPVSFWRTAQFDVHNALESPDMHGWARDAEGVYYSRIMLNRAQVEELWPAVEGDEVSEVETAAKEWWRLRQIDVASSKAQMAEQVKAVRRAQIAKGRDMAHEFTKTANVDSCGFRAFLEEKRDYADLRPHLSIEFLEKLHRPRTAYGSNRESAYPALVAWFLEDLERLERELEL